MSAATGEKPDAVFTRGPILRHVAVMSATGAVGLTAIFAVDLLSLLYISWLGQVNVTAGVGFATTVFPAARAGAIFQLNKYRGRFHGEMQPTTPSGWRSV